jgi:hypothetical protein
MKIRLIEISLELIDNQIVRSQNNFTQSKLIKRLER